jgi:hypothetical protein
VKILPFVFCGAIDLSLIRDMTDHDGTLDQKEAKAMPGVAKNFDAIDADKDGTVSLEEVHTFMKAQHEPTKN